MFVESNESRKNIQYQRLFGLGRLLKTLLNILLFQYNPYQHNTFQLSPYKSVDLPQYH